MLLFLIYSSVWSGISDRSGMTLKVDIQRSGHIFKCLKV